MQAIVFHLTALLEHLAFSAVARLQLGVHGVDLVDHGQCRRRVRADDMQLRMGQAGDAKPVVNNA